MSDDTSFSSRSIREFHNALTNGSIFGVPRYTTALLPSVTGNQGGLAYDTTLGALTVCSGSAWGAVGSFTGGTITTPILAAAGTVGAPSYSFSAAPTYGFYLRSGVVIETAIGGTAASQFSSTGLQLNTGGSLQFSTGNVASASAGSSFGLNTSQTPDTLVIGTSTLGNSLIIAEFADITFDFAHAQATDPTLFIHSHNQSTTQWIGFAHNGTNGVLSTGAGALSLTSTGNQIYHPAGTNALPGISFAGDTALGFWNSPTGSLFWSINGTTKGLFNSTQLLIHGSSAFGWSPAGPDAAGADTGLARSAAGVIKVTNGSTGNGQLSLEVGGQRIASNKVTLTEAGGAELVASITTATTEMTGGTLNYVVRCTDGTNRAARAGSINFVCQNAAGTVTAALSAAAETTDGSAVIATGGATLTYAITADVATANVMKIMFNIDSSLVVTVASITYTMTLNGPGTVA